jgi:6-phosphogluconolactonase
MGDGAARMIRVGEDGSLLLKDVKSLGGHSILPRQQGPRIHSVQISPDGKLLAAANLGADEVVLFKVDREQEKLVVADCAIVDFGQGPRHMAFHPNGEYLYVATEMGSRIYCYKILEQKLVLLAAYPTGDPFRKEGMMASDILVSSDGKFVYTSSRTQNTISCFKILKDGYLDVVGYYDCGGKNPRGICFSTDEKMILCANNETENIAVIERNTDSGVLQDIIESLAAPKAGCVRVN